MRIEETGLDHFEARDYDSRLARWLNPDPARQFWSPYMAMGNNPVSGVDPDGREYYSNWLTGEQKWMDGNDKGNFFWRINKGNGFYYRLEGGTYLFSNMGDVEIKGRCPIWLNKNNGNSYFDNWVLNPKHPEYEETKKIFC